MKKQFFDYMLEVMRSNKDVYFIMAGLGYPRVDEFLKEFPDRAFNFEASEQTCLDACVGLAYAGKIPVVYSIAPFLLYRGFETWRTYINHEKLHVIGVGAGRDDEYAIHDGFSHDASDDMRLFNIATSFDDIPGILDNVNVGKPENEGAMKTILDEAIKSKNPWYINVKRS